MVGSTATLVAATSQNDILRTAKEALAPARKQLEEHCKIAVGSYFAIMSESLEHIVACLHKVKTCSSLELSILSETLSRKTLEALLIADWEGVWWAR
jgi:hypothetical protein